MNPTVEQIAFGITKLSPLPVVPWRRKVRAFYAYWRAVRIYRKKGYPGAREYIIKLEDKFSPIETTNSEMLRRIAQKVTTPLRIWGRILKEERICLPQAVSLVAGLIALGIKAQVSIGKNKNMATVAGTRPFHAWTEVNGKELQFEGIGLKYSVVTKHPKWEEKIRKTDDVHNE